VNIQRRGGLQGSLIPVEARVIFQITSSEWCGSEHSCPAGDLVPMPRGDSPQRAVFRLSILRDRLELF